ncbi:uncharacterized protein [Ptychodera flava]|uniref:uncharacterized protein n=1 Tax=Ptychodera flava TaxID=63121 RepID=UPI00396AAF16
MGGGLSCLSASNTKEVAEPPEMPGEATLPTITLSQWAKLQDRDPTIQCIRTLVHARTDEKDKMTRKQRANESQEVRIALRDWSKFSFCDDVLYRARTSSSGEVYYQLVLPHEFHQEAMKGVHDDCGHLGQDRSIDLLRARFYWPLMSADMKKYIRTCKRCTRRKDEAGLKTRAPMLSIELRNR